METPQPKIIDFAYKAPVAFAMIFAALYGIQLFVDISNGSTTLINAAFAIMLGLSAVCFSFSGAQKSEDIADRLAFAGERLLHGAILVIATSLIKYLLFMTNSIVDITSSNLIVKSVFWLVTIIACAIFTNGLLFAHTGIRVLNDLLILRMTRHKDWDKNF